MAEHMVLQECCWSAVPDAAGHRVGRPDRAPRGRRARRGAGRAGAGQPCLVRGLRSGRDWPSSRRSRRAGTGRCSPPTSPRPAATWPRRFGADEVDRPGRGLAAPALGRLRRAGVNHGAGDRRDDRGGRWTPVIFEAVGVPGMLQSLIARRPAPQPDRRRGRVHAHRRHRALHGRDKEIELRFSFGYSPAEFAATLDRLAAGCPGADALVTLDVSTSTGAPAAFDIAAHAGRAWQDPCPTRNERTPRCMTTLDATGPPEVRRLPGPLPPGGPEPDAGPRARPAADRAPGPAGLRRGLDRRAPLGRLRDHRLAGGVHRRRRRSGPGTSGSAPGCPRCPTTTPSCWPTGWSCSTT